MTNNNQQDCIEDSLLWKPSSQHHRSPSFSEMSDYQQLIEGGINTDIIPEQLGLPTKPHYDIFLVVFPVFCGYAALFSMQKELKKMLGIKDGDTEISHLFGVGVSMLYIFNFIFRMGHNFVFFFASPRIRVLISMVSMGISMSLLSLLLFKIIPFKSPASLAWVFLAYGFGGVAIGSFESNILSSITPLGKETKFWAIVAIPVGVNAITIGGFSLLTIEAIQARPGVIHLGVLILLVIGVAVFVFRFYVLVGDHNSTSFWINNFFSSLVKWKLWLWELRWQCLALMFDMFFVSLFSPGVILYIYTDDYITFPWFGTRLKRDWFIAIYNACFFLGDTSSRKIFYMLPLVQPMFFLGFSVIGMAIGLSHVTEIVPLCAFFVAFANGSMYSQTNNKIDSVIHPQFNLISFSFWLFIGDIGSVVGSNLISFVRDWVQEIYGSF